MVQRFYSTFPRGAPGGGLFLLRVAAGVIALTQSVGLLSSPDERTVFVWAGSAIASVSGLLLVIGLLTPAASAFVAITSVTLGVGWIRSALPTFTDPISSSFLVIVAFAIVLLGPGAYSLDAYLFGRREIVIPGPRDH